MHRPLILLLFIGLSCTAPQTSPPPPNVLFIAIDDLRPELGAYGNTVIQTPHLDRLAEEGATFMRAYVQQAVCNPSRASLMTGLRPDALKVWDLQTDFRETVPDVVTLPQHFMAHGYHTAAIGKIYHNTLPDSASWSENKLHIDGYPFDPDAVYRDSAQVAYQETRKQKIITDGDSVRYIDQLGQWYLKAGSTEAPDLPDNAYFDGAQTDVAVEKLAELKQRNQPFFFAVGYYRPHLPFNAPKKYWDLYDPAEIPTAANPDVPDNVPVMAMNNMRELRGYTDFNGVPHPIDGGVSEEDARRLKHGYYASVSYIDAQVGRLLEALDELGLAESTIVVVWGDHGWKLGEHNSWGKMTNFEIDAHAPWMMRVPGQQGGVQVQGLVEFIDLYPTLSELAGLPIPDHVQGQSAVPLLEAPNAPGKPAVFTQFLREGIWIAPDGIEYMGYSTRTDQYRYTRWVNWEAKAQVAEELYDHNADPGETVNLAPNPEYSALLDSLRTLAIGN